MHYLIFKLVADYYIYIVFYSDYIYYITVIACITVIRGDKK